jgi:molecular chaperone DnaJ
MTTMGKDYYKTLGIEKNASADEIKKAFRKLAHEHHPDKTGGDDKKFKEASEAYSVLSDEKKRQQYDTFGSADAGGFGGGQGGGFGGFDFSGFQQGGNMEFDLGDIFGEFFGGGRGGRRERTPRGNDISIDIELTFKESIFGVEKDIHLNTMSKCDHCNGTGGEPNTEIVTCAKCHGDGKITETKNSIFGSFATQRTCPDCNGSGKIPKQKCKVCHGHTVYRKEHSLKVKIPSGIENGEMVRLSGAGETAPHGTTGDLYIRAHVKPHSQIHKEGNNLVMKLPIKLTEALLGGEHLIETLDGPVTLKIPQGVHFGEILRMKEKGVPTEGRRRGDFLVHIEIEMPKKISKQASKLIDELKNEGI